jgi:hypothetical protein
MRHLLTIFLATCWLTSTAQTLDLSDTIAARQQLRADLDTIKKLIKDDRWTYDYIQPKFFDMLVDSVNFSHIQKVLDTTSCEHNSFMYWRLDFDTRARLNYSCYDKHKRDYGLSAKDTVGSLIITQAKKRFDVWTGGCLTAETKRGRKQRFLKGLFGDYHLVIEVNNKQAKYYFKPPPDFDDRIKVRFYGGKF